ncbi:Fc.00g104850.m01.CDS01 [Cosmosporella sp. VM-42]
MSAQFKFVTLGKGNERNDNASDKLLIRSHCMRGKNKRADSRRSIRQAKRAVKEASQQTRPAPTSQPIPVLDLVLSTMANGHAPPSARAEAQSLAYEVLLLRLRGPLTPPSHPAVARFADKSHKTTQEIMHQVINFGRFTDTSYTIERCIDFDIYRNNNPALLLFDDVFFHSILLTTYALHDFSMRRPLAKTSRFYLGRTLALLNEQLSDDKAYMLDSTMYVMLCLTVMACIFGDYTATSAHISGLQRIVHLRGGFEYLRLQHKLHFKLESADLVWCLSFGGVPRFLEDPLTWDPFFIGPWPISDNRMTQLSSSDRLDPRLLATFHDLQYLAALVNDHYQTKTRLRANLFQPAMSSIQARLLKLKDMPTDRPSQGLCLAALAFLTTTFQLPGSRLPYTYLAHRLRNCYDSIISPSPELENIFLWLLMVCAISVIDVDESWIRASWKAVVKPELLWEEARASLDNVMWIGCIHDELGREAFSALMR